MNKLNRPVRHTFSFARTMVLIVAVAGIVAPPARASEPLVLAFLLCLV